MTDGGPKESERLFGRDYPEKYDEWSKVPWLRHLEKRQQETIMGLLSPEKVERIIDVGCGTGKYVIRLAESCDFVIGADYSRDMIKKASAKIKSLGLDKKVLFVLADGAALPFKDKAFDKGISVNTVQYVPDDRKFITEIGRVCGKKLVLDAICSTELRMIYPMFALRNRFRAGRGKSNVGRYRNFYTPNSLRKKVSECGFIPDRMIGCGVTLPHIYREAYGLSLPSPYHILNIIPCAYRVVERLEKRFGNTFPIRNLSTHLVVEILLN
jgi:SAM-dependent methyltransferase